MDTNLTIPDLMKRWRCTKGALAQLRYNGTGPKYMKIGRTILYRPADIEAYEAANTHQSTADETAA